MGLLHLDALILDARLRQSLVAIRSLGQRGLRIGAVETASNVPAFSSRWCEGCFSCPAKVATDAYLDYVDGLLDIVPTPVLIPSHDGTIALVRRQRAHLERRARVALAGEEALAVAVDKVQTLAAAQSLGITVPRSVTVTTAGDLTAALADIGLPAVVKPAESWSCKGVRVAAQLVTTRDEANRAVADLCRLDATPLFQPFLSGRREAVSFLYADGEIHARFAQWAKRTGPPLGGESVLRQSIEVPQDLGKPAERLIREIGLEGYSEVEFRRDRNGVPFLMEINPRLSASVELAVRCGVDFPHLIYQWATGRSIDTVERYRVGGWMRYLRGDLMTTIAAIRERGRPGVTPPVRAVLDFGLSFFKPMAYDYLDWHDPLPAIKAAGDFARTAARAFVRKPATLLRSERHERRR